MVKRFRHRGLKRLYENNDRSGLNAKHVEKLRRILARMEVAEKPEDMDMPGWRLHQLKGDLLGVWSVTVSGNWRVIFRFDDGNVTDVDLIDYH